MQMRTVRKDKVKYDVHRRLRASSAGYEHDQSNAQKMEEFIKVIEEEKSKLKKEKEKQKQESKRIAEAKKKLEIQRRELAEAIEKIYDVEKGIDDKFSDLDKLHKYTKNLKVDSAKVMEDSNKLGEGTGEVLADIKDSILELLRQEQRVAGECLKLERERRQLEVTRQTLVCAGCSRPLTKSVSARDVRQAATGAGDWAEMISIRRKYEEQPIAWMDLHQQMTEQKVNKVNMRNLKSSRTSGDGASREALDSHVTALKIDADNDRKFLEDER